MYLSHSHKIALFFAESTASRTVLAVLQEPLGLELINHKHDNDLDTLAYRDDVATSFPDYTPVLTVREGFARMGSMWNRMRATEVTTVLGYPDLWQTFPEFLEYARRWAENPAVHPDNPIVNGGPRGRWFAEIGEWRSMPETCGEIYRRILSRYQLASRLLHQETLLADLQILATECGFQSPSTLPQLGDSLGGSDVTEFDNPQNRALAQAYYGDDNLLFGYSE
jgi:hypothetical protein